MKFFILLKINIKMLLKNKKNIISSFLIPALIVLLMGFIFTKIQNSDNQSALILSDKGSYGKEFVNEIKKTTSIKIYEKQDGIEKVKSRKLSACYEVPENFSDMINKGEKPHIVIYQLEKGVEPGNFQFNANSIINKMVLRNEFKTNGTDVTLQQLSYKKTNIKVVSTDKTSIDSVGDVVLLNIIISFSLFGAIGIATEFFELKKQNVLKRSFTTANKPKTILGSTLTAMFIISSIGYSAIFVLSSLMFSSNNFSKCLIIILNIVLMVFMALSLGMLVTRLVKNENLIPMVLNIVISVTCFIGGSFMPIEFLPKSITMFSKFTPQYWALQSINTGNPWLSLMVLLFSLVFFTAGTYKTKDFI